MSRFTIRPGVYVESVSIQPKSIEFVDTDTAAFLGETKTGPATAMHVTSWLQFQAVFGGFFESDKYLPYAVWGFFENGGQSCFICKVTDNNYEAALSKLETVEPLSIVYSPNASATAGLTDALIAHCEKLKRFCILDSQKSQMLQDISKPKKASSFAALYYPWIYVKPDGATQICLVPPGGHIAGVYARVDAEVGVHRAPANQQVKGVVALEREVNQQQQETLNLNGINCIRSFTGRGILVWGARTLSDESEYKYVNVRRLMIFLERSIEQGTAWAVFEPNNEATWLKVRLQVQNFLTACWENGMLMGSKPQEAFFVRCDRSTMTQRDLDLGRLNVLVGAAAVKPAEFLILQLTHNTAK